MWKCTKCREQIDDTVQVCWSCGTIRDSEPGATATGTPSDGARRSIDQLIFVGLNGYALALDARTGALLWKANVGGSVSNGPMTYMVGGRQYVAFAAGSSLFVYALRQ